LLKVTHHAPDEGSPEPSALVRLKRSCYAGPSTCCMRQGMSLVRTGPAVMSRR
jgi:hypothetical protein